jgi:hypothetical protein
MATQQMEMIQSTEEETVREAEAGAAREALEDHAKWLAEVTLSAEKKFGPMPTPRVDARDSQVAY